MLVLKIVLLLHICHILPFLVRLGNLTVNRLAEIQDDIYRLSSIVPSRLNIGCKFVYLLLPTRCLAVTTYGIDFTSSLTRHYAGNADWLLLERARQMSTRLNGHMILVLWFARFDLRSPGNPYRGNRIYYSD